MPGRPPARTATACRRLAHRGHGLRCWRPSLPSASRPRRRNESNSPQPTGLSHGVHDLPEKILVAQVFGLVPITGTFDDLASETRDLRRGDLAEVPRQRIAGLELPAVDQQGAGPGKPVAVCIEVAEQLETAVLEPRRSPPHSHVRSRRCSRRRVFDVEVLLHTTMKHGGTSIPAFSQRSKVVA